MVSNKEGPRITLKGDAVGNAIEVITMSKSMDEGDKKKPDWWKTHKGYENEIRQLGRAASIGLLEAVDPIVAGETDAPAELVAWAVELTNTYGRRPRQRPAKS